MIWRPHPRYPMYEASDRGEIRRNGRTIKLFARHGGYLGGNISVDGRRINFDAHRFVCEAFHGLADDRETRHLNGIPNDNRPANLAWGTHSENQQDIARHGRNHELNKTHCPAGHPYDKANTYRAPGAPTKRMCRACMRKRERLRVRR